jgi:hypothetical protein
MFPRELLRRGRGAVAAVVCALAWVGSAQAQVWDEFADGGGDAVDLPPGQLTIGTGPLIEIRGRIGNPDLDVDMYCIFVPDPQAFTASVFEPSVGLSAELWLFDAAGNGIAHASDTTAPYNPQILVGLVPTAGTYFIAISRLGLAPVDGIGNPIFPTIGSGMTGPNASAGPIAGWNGPGSGAPGGYSIFMEGAAYHGDGGGPGGGDDGSQPDGGPCWTYTTRDHFAYGNLFNIEHFTDPTGDDCIRLVDEPRAWPFGAAAMSGSNNNIQVRRGSVIRYATENIPSLGISEGDVLGEYFTAPKGMANNPSRTTVDGFGNVYVGNRDESGVSLGQNKGSVTRIGLALGGTRVDSSGAPDPTGDYLQGPFEYCSCEDRDGDGLIKTSRGYAHTTGAFNADYQFTALPWDNSAGADSNGGVSTAEDECITAYYRTEGTGVRHVSVDANNNVWVGGWANRQFELIDGALMAQVTAFQSACGGYGGVVDPAGILWSANWGGCGSTFPGNFMRYDPVTLVRQCLDIPNYGVSVDADCSIAGTSFPYTVWTTCPYTSSSYRVSPVGVQIGSPIFHGGSSSLNRGTVVKNGSVWVGHSTSNTVGRIVGTSWAGNVTMQLGTIPGSGPHGVAVDRQQQIWAINRLTSNAMRIDPTIGVAGQVDLAVDLGPNGFPYNYSDFTGDVYMTSSPQGTWTFVHDGGKDSCAWGTLSWSAQIIGNASITVRVRASNSPVPSGPWTVVSNNVAFSGVTGRYLQVQVTMSRQVIDCEPAGEVSLCDLTICKESDCWVELDEVICGTQNPGQLTFTGTVFNNSGLPASQLLITPIPVGSGVSFTPNIIPVNIPSGSSGSFTTTATGWTDGEELCFLVTLLDPTYQVCCTTEVCWDVDCECLQVRDSTERIVCDPVTGQYTYTFQFDNLTNDTLFHAFLIPPSGVTITPNYFAFPGGILPNTTSPPLTVVITGASAGEFCFDLTIHDAVLFECCSRKVCVDLPECGVDPGGGTGTGGTGAPGNPGAPWVVLDAGLPTACGPDAHAVLTIVNNGPEARAFRWHVVNGNFVGCDWTLPEGAISPSEGMTDILEPGRCVDIPISIDTASMPDDAIACLRGVIVDEASGFSASTAGQIFSPSTFDEEGPAITVSACHDSVGQVLAIQPGASSLLTFQLNGEGGAARAIEYEIRSSNPFLSLNGQEPGHAVRGVVDLAPGQPDFIPVEVDLVAPSGSWLMHVTLSARLAGVQYPVGPRPLATATVRDSMMENCTGDFNHDGIVDLRDINDFVAAFVARLPTADLNRDGVIDLSDVNLFVSWFVNGCV